MVAPVPSSQSLQRDTRIVVLRILKYRSHGLGDPGPDDADMYARVRIDGQLMASSNIEGFDSFGFANPYEPWTWIKAVPAVPNEREPVSSMEVEVRTADVSRAGTDDDVYLRVGPNLRFPLDKRLYDDFERGDRDWYSVPIDAADRQRPSRGRYPAGRNREVEGRDRGRLEARRGEAARERAHRLHEPAHRPLAGGQPPHLDPPRTSLRAVRAARGSPCG